MSKHNSTQAFASTDSDDAEIRKVLESAGRRPRVPEAELAGLRAEARSRWLDMVEQERQRARFSRKNTVLALAASLLLAVAVGWWLMPDWGGVAPDLVATVELVRGDLYSGSTRVEFGSSVASGSVLVTGAESSRAALRLPGAQSVRLDSNTRVRLISDSSFELERGAVYVDTHDAAPGAGIEVSTAFGVVRDIGTQFLIRLDEGADEQMTVRVREGEVVIEARSARQAARAGEEVILRQGSNSIETTRIERHGAAWDWIETVTPVIDIDGASLDSYLEWVSRETGRELRYADGALATAAKSITLSGTIEGLTPEESLEILPGSGLGHRIENGWLLVEQPRE